MTHILERLVAYLDNASEGFVGFPAADCREASQAIRKLLEKERKIPLAGGQIWTPAIGKRVKPREIVEVADRDGVECVCWVEVTEKGRSLPSWMLVKGFLGWVRIHRATVTYREENV